MNKPQNTRSDRIFDGWAERFNKRIYAANNPKGIIRTAVLQRDLQDFVLNQNQQPLRVIDIGGGLGQMSLWLSEQGHDVVYCEPSVDMFASALEKFNASVSPPQRSIQCSLQNINKQFDEEFDLVLFHAVLEWMAEPITALGYLQPLVKRDGFLSLLFYNKHSSVMRSLVVGDFQRVKNDSFAGDGKKRLAPISPLEPEHVASWVHEHDFHIERWSGVRAFYDYMLPQIRLAADLNEVLQQELRLSLEQPWRSIARYQHMICKRQ